MNYSIFISFLKPILAQGRLTRTEVALPMAEQGNPPFSVAIHMPAQVLENLAKNPFTVFQ
jgi:hypothetical protein